MTAANPGPVPAQAAATVIVGRDGPDGLEVLFLRRSDHGPFGGMWVFPGGRVDEADAEGVSGDEDRELALARRAAVREAAEEVGLVLDAAALVPFSHWTPPEDSPRRRYATWFFVAPWGGDPVTIDGHEIVDHRWVRAADAMALALPMAPPTYVTLHQLAVHATWPQLVDGLATWPVERYLTRNGRLADGTTVLMWTGDAGYDTGDPDRAGPRHRLRHAEGRSLAYERHGG
jgi:8-oxo-dGTP pyrophosphatase MutT (NUDIX family)